MKLSKQISGQKFCIYYIVFDDGSCPAGDFLEQLKQNNVASHRSLVILLKRHAEYGQIMNERKSKCIEGRRNLFEFKSSQGDRLTYFYLKGWRTVLIHGFHKGAPAGTEYDRAERIRDQYLREVEDV